MKNLFALLSLIIIGYLAAALFVFGFRNNKIVTIDSKFELIQLLKFGRVVEFKNNPNRIEIIPPNYLDIPHVLDKISLSAGLSEEQRETFNQISEEFLLTNNFTYYNNFGPTENLVSFGRAINKLAEEIQSDSLESHGFVSPGDFDEIKTWKKVSKLLNEYKYE